MSPCIREEGILTRLSHYASLVRIVDMQTVNIHTAKTNLSRLVDQAAAGEEIVIARSGRPVARLVSLAAPSGGSRRRLGLLAGQIFVPPDFDAPLPEDVLAAFHGH